MGGKGPLLKQLLAVAQSVEAEAWRRGEESLQELAQDLVQEEGAQERVWETCGWGPGARERALLLWRQLWVCPAWIAHRVVVIALRSNGMPCSRSATAQMSLSQSIRLWL